MSGGLLRLNGSYTQPIQTQPKAMPKQPVTLKQLVKQLQ